MSRSHSNGWIISEDDVESIALGAGVLGTGGGGNPYLGKWRLWGAMQRGQKAHIVSPDAVPDDALVATVGGMGAPTVGIERIQQGYEMTRALEALAKFVGQPIPYVISGEIGGSNSLSGLIVAAQSGRMVVDGDGMGRAFPELQMDTFVIGGVKVHPIALCDVRGQTTIIEQALDAFWVERIARAVTVQLGGSSGIASHLMTGADMKRTAVWDTLTLTKRLGDIVRHARAQRTDPAEAVAEFMSGHILFRGKIVDVRRWTTAGFARGNIRLRAHNKSDEMVIDFQNENLIARCNGEVVATVPDLITLLAEDDGEPVSTEVLRYGLRVVVLGMPCTPKFQTEAGLSIVGPRAFGYDLDYKPLSGQWPRRVS